MKTILSGSILFSILLGLNACFTPHYMYAPSALNTPALTHKKENSLTGSVSLHGIDLQASYAINDHLGVSSNLFYRQRRENHNYPTFLTTSVSDSLIYRRKGVSLDMIYYTPLDRNEDYFLSVLWGYGLGHFSMKEHHKTFFYRSLIIDSVFRYTTHSQRIILQPSVMRTFPQVKIIFSVRGLLYRQYSITSDFPTKEIDLIGNKWYLFCEPSIACIIRPKDLKWIGFKAQFGVSVAGSKISFEYKPFIGNIGLVFYPFKWND